MKKKYLLVIIIFLLAVICAVGGSTWIILSEQTKAPKEFTEDDKFTTEIDVSEITKYFSNAENKIYYGENIDETITQKAKVLTPAIDKDGNVIKEENGGTKYIDIKSFGTFTLTESTATLKGEGDSETGVAATTSISFTLGEDYKYVYKTPENIEITVPMYAVADYNNSTYYSTVDQALAEVQDEKSEATVTVICSTDKTKDTSAKTISTSATIPDKVDFILEHTSGAKYTPDTTDGKTRNADHRKGTNASFADTNSSNLTNLVTIKENVTLNVEGSLIIGGILGREGQTPSGHTSGAFAQITLNNDSTITSSGLIDCLGYIKEVSNTTNAEIIMNDGGTIYTPFVIFDYRGGAYTVGVYMGGQVMPFNQYSVVNLHTTLTVNYRASLIGYADLYTGPVTIPYVNYTLSAQHNHTTVNLVGTSNSVINLTSGAKAVAVYSPKNSSGNWSSVTTKYGTTDLSIEGGATLGSMELTVTAAGKTVTVTTGTILFSIPWNYAIHLKNGDYAIGYPIKFLSGSSLTVNNDAELTLNSNVIFYPPSTTDRTTGAQANYFCDWATSNGTNSDFVGISEYPTKNAATLTVGGNLILNKGFGGTVYASSSSASVTVNSTATITSNEGWGDVDTEGMFSLYLGGDGGTFTVTDSISDSLHLPNINGEEFTSTGTYYAMEISSNNYAWGKRASLTINYETFDYSGITGLDENPKTYGTLFLDTTYTLTEEDLPQVELNHYTFDGWYHDDTFTNKAAIGDPVDLPNAENSITLYPKFIPITYTIEYEYTGLGETTYPDIPDSLPTEFTIESGNIIFPADIIWENSTYKFTGWYYDSELKNGVPREKAIDFETLFSYTKNGTLTLYGNWAEKEYNVTFITDGEHGYNIGTLTSKPASAQYDPTQDSEINKKVIAYDNQTDKLYYFAGWYIDADLQSVYDPTVGLTEESTTLYAKWLEKNILTFDVNESEADTPNPDNIENMYLRDNQICKLPTFESDNDPSVTKYMSGWTITSGTGTVANGEITGVSSNVDLKATWKNKSSLTYTNTAGETVSTEYYKPGATATLNNHNYTKAAVFTPNGNTAIYTTYSAGYWYITAPFENIETYTFNSTMVENITLNPDFVGKGETYYKVTISASGTNSIKVTATAGTMRENSTSGTILSEVKSATSFYVSANGSIIVFGESSKTGAVLTQSKISISSSSGESDEDSTRWGKASLSLDINNITSAITVTITGS